MDAMKLYNEITFFSEFKSIRFPLRIETRDYNLDAWNDSYSFRRMLTP